MGTFSIGKHSMPKKAKKVFEGILYDTYHWEQKLFDGSYKTFEKVVRLPACKAFVVNKDKLIMLKEEQPHRKPFTSLPGGLVDRGHEPEFSIKKELLEELGMKVKDVKLWKIFGRDGNVSWDTYYYIVKKYEIVQEPKIEAGEKNQPYEVTFEEFLEELQKDEYIDRILGYQISRMNEKELNDFKKLLFS